MTDVEAIVHIINSELELEVAHDVSVYVRRDFDRGSFVVCRDGCTLEDYDDATDAAEAYLKAVAEYRKETQRINDANEAD